MTVMENHKIIKEFTCSISGDECMIVLDFESNQEMCILKSDYYHTEEVVHIDPNWRDNLPDWEKGYLFI